MGLRVTTILIGVLLAFPSSAFGTELPPGGTFIDDDGNVHEGFIEAIADQGVTRGCNPPTNDRYCPGNSVTREQMAAFLVRALGLTDADHPGFVDVVTGSTFDTDIRRLAKAGITRGCNPPTNDRYCPEDFVTREQMAAFLVRAFGYVDSEHPGFIDVATGSTFDTDIRRLAKEGVTQGCNPPANDRYCPGDLVKRDQMASFLGRAMGLTPTTPPPVVSFTDGTWRVGVDIPAGRYRNTDSSQTCYWERLSGFSGEFEDIIANDLISHRTVVDIKPSDTGFSSNRCTEWTNRVTQLTTSRTAPFGDGMWIVGLDIEPGTWRNSDSSQSCYWERLSGFTGEFEDIIANNLSQSIQTVTISPGDVGFRSNRCGTWTRIG